MKRIAATLLTAGMLLTRTAMAVSWSVPHAGGAGSALGLSVQLLSTEVASASSGRFELKPETGADQDRIDTGLDDGAISAAAQPLEFLARKHVLIGMDQVPFLATSFGDARKLWQVLLPQVERRLSERGLVLLYAVPGPPVALLSQRPITRVEDVRGARLVMDAARASDFVRLTGAKAAKRGARSAVMKSGVADLAFVSASEAVADKAWTYGRYFISAAAWFPKQLVVVRRDALTSLDRSLRDALLSAADRARDAAWASAEQETRARTQNLRDRGVKVRTPDVGLVVKLEDLGRELLFLWSEDAGESGAELVEAYYAIK